MILCCLVLIEPTLFSLRSQLTRVNFSKWPPRDPNWTGRVPWWREGDFLFSLFTKLLFFLPRGCSPPHWSGSHPCQFLERRGSGRFGDRSHYAGATQWYAHNEAEIRVAPPPDNVDCAMASSVFTFKTLLKRELFENLWVQSNSLTITYMYYKSRLNSWCALWCVYTVEVWKF